MRKGLTHIDNKRGEFSVDSSFAPELRAYFRGERGFIDLSVQIAEFISSELGRMSKAESTDLLVVDFEEETKLEGGSADDAEIEHFATPRYHYRLSPATDSGFEGLCGKNNTQGQLALAA